MKAERRISQREQVEQIEITGFTSLDHLTLIARHARLIDASSSGLLIALEHRDLLPKNLRENLTLKALEGDQVMLTIPKMNLEIAGKVTRTRLVSKKTYEIAVDFSEDAPEFWRECLLELLPRPGELD